MVNLMTTVQLLTELQTDSADTDAGTDIAVPRWLILQYLQILQKQWFCVDRCDQSVLDAPPTYKLSSTNNPISDKSFVWSSESVSW